MPIGSDYSLIGFRTANLRRKNEITKHFPEKINFVTAIIPETISKAATPAADGRG